MKRLVSLLLIFTIVLAFSACGGKSDEPANMLAVKDPTGWGLVKLMTDRSYAFNMTYCDTPEEAVEGLKNGSADFAALPVDAAAKAFNETNGEIRVIAITSTGGHHAVTRDENVKSAEDLAGNTFYISKTESFAQRLLAYIINNAEGGGLKAETVTLDSNEAVSKKAIEEKTGAYVMPVFSAAETLTKTEGLAKAISLPRAWEKITGSQLAFGCIVARREYAEKNPERVSELREFAEVSLNYMSGNEAAGDVLIETGLFEDNNIAENIIPGCCFAFIDGEEAVTCVTETLTRLYSEDSGEIGGKIPGSEFFLTA